MDASTPNRTRIKICGLTLEQDVDDAVRAGADAIGFVDRLAGDVRLAPSSPGYQAASGKDVGADVALVNALMAEVV